MFRTLSIVAFASAAMIWGASAADLPRKSVVPVFAAPAFTWSGFYVGLNAGYAWSADKRVDLRPGVDPGGVIAGALAAGAIPRTIDLDSKGFIGGAQLGYNHQFAGTAIVAGVEADLQYTGMKAGSTVIVPGIPVTINANIRMDYFGTVRARLGVAVAPQFLVYATGGLAFGQIKYSGFGSGPGFFLTSQDSKTQVGWTVGAGAEYALTSNISVKAEYLYYQLEKTSGQTSPFPGPLAQTIAFERKNTGHIARIGVNYRF